MQKTMAPIDLNIPKLKSPNASSCTNFKTCISTDRSLPMLDPKYIKTVMIDDIKYRHNICLKIHVSMFIISKTIHN